MALMLHEMAWLGCGMFRINAIGESGRLFQYARPYYCWRRAQATKPFEQKGYSVDSGRLPRTLAGPGGLPPRPAGLRSALLQRRCVPPLPCGASLALFWPSGN